jgi:hypothetical protein
MVDGGWWLDLDILNKFEHQTLNLFTIHPLLHKCMKVIYNRETWGCKGFDVLAKAAL